MKSILTALFIGIGFLALAQDTLFLYPVKNADKPISSYDTLRFTELGNREELHYNPLYKLVLYNNNHGVLTVIESSLKEKNGMVILTDTIEKTIDLYVNVNNDSLRRLESKRVTIIEHYFRLEGDPPMVSSDLIWSVVGIDEGDTIHVLNNQGFVLQSNVVAICNFNKRKIQMSFLKPGSLYRKLKGNNPAELRKNSSVENVYYTYQRKENEIILIRKK